MSYFFRELVKDYETVMFVECNGEDRNRCPKKSRSCRLNTGCEDDCGSRSCATEKSKVVCEIPCFKQFEI